MTYEALLVLFIVWCCRRDKQPSYSVLTTAFEAHWIISLVEKCITGSCDDLSGPCEILPSSNASGNLGVSGMNVKVIKPDYSGMWWASTFCSTFIHLTIRRLIVSGRGGGGLEWVRLGVKTFITPCNLTGGSVVLPRRLSNRNVIGTFWIQEIKSYRNTSYHLVNGWDWVSKPS